VINGLREAPTLFEAAADERILVTDKVRREVYERDGWKCRSCGNPDDLTVDHVWPHSRGGTNAFENLQTLCKTCNATKGDAA
jgi:5-methylcytosine-specific restriction endonuclease McrA